MSWWRRLLRREQLEQRLDKELRFHIDQHAADLIARGIDPDEAGRRARIELGGAEQVKEECRDARGTRWLEDIAQDIRYSLRMLRLNPGFAAVAILSLALGTGVNTAIFQLIDAVRLRTLPVEAPQQLAEVRIDDMTHARGNWIRDMALSNPLWEKIRAGQKSFSAMFAWADESLNVSTSGEFREAAGLWVSGDAFRVLGVKPILGRVFTAADDRRGCGLSPGAVISYGYWQREFAGDRSIIGRQIPLGKERIAVIGITPPEFYGLEIGRTFDIALPICSEPAFHHANARLDSGTTWWLTVMGRLKPGVSLEQASAQLRASSAGVFETVPSDFPQASIAPYRAMKLFAIPAGHGISRLRDMYSMPLALLLAIAGLVLLIACVNLANLMLARASARQRELAVRLAIGASRTRLARQMITEGLLLAFVGAALGLAMARVLSGFLVTFVTNPADPIFVDLHQDFRIFGFTAALAILTCLVFATVPAFRVTRTDPGDVLRSGSRGMTAGRERLNVRRALVATQIAVSLLLLMGTLLFVRSLRNLQTLDPGFQTHGVLVANISFRDMQLPPGRVTSFRKEMLDRLRAIPGVDAVSEITVLPLSGANWNNRMWMNGSDLDHAKVALRSMIGTDYFRTLRTPLRSGRDFTQQDLDSFAKFAIVNEEFAKQVTGSLDAVGKRFRVETTPFEPESQFEIVGVVKNTKYRDLREEFQPVMFQPLSEAAVNRPAIRLLIRSGANPEKLVAAVRNTLATISPAMMYSFQEFDTWVKDSLLRERLMATLSALFGVLGVILTAVGLYGVISYTVAQRTNEIGIRIALGAGRRAVIAMVLKEATIVLAAGLIVGGILTVAAGRAAVTLLFGLKPNDPLTFVMAGVSLAVLSLAASYLPAWRASGVNPVIALRQE